MISTLQYWKKNFDGSIENWSEDEFSWTLHEWIDECHLLKPNGTFYR
jgi:site-specific DNA-methyltransferase (adenine-specific)/adenine-specific DNA-methyltransferase